MRVQAACDSLSGCLLNAWVAAYFRDRSEGSVTREASQIIRTRSNDERISRKMVCAVTRGFVASSEL